MNGCEWTGAQRTGEELEWSFTSVRNERTLQGVGPAIPGEWNYTLISRDATSKVLHLMKWLLPSYLPWGNHQAPARALWLRKGEITWLWGLGNIQEFFSLPLLFGVEPELGQSSVPSSLSPCLQAQGAGHALRSLIHDLESSLESHAGFPQGPSPSSNCRGRKLRVNQGFECECNSFWSLVSNWVVVSETLTSLQSLSPPLRGRV